MDITTRDPRACKTLSLAFAALRPPPELTVHEWAERYRYVPRGSSPDPGRWVSKPYQRAVMEAYTDPRAEGTVFVACSQGGGKTEVCLNIIGYNIHHDPGPQIVIEPTIEMAETLSKDRVAPMIAATPVLSELVGDPKSRDSDNTIRHKAYPGGHSTFVGANSAPSLAMRPERDCIADEIDRYAASAGTEGDGLKLAETRTTAYWNARKFWATSPGNAGASRSEGLWARSDKHEYLVRCPDCNERQRLEWAHVQWEKGDDGEHRPETAGYACPHCGSLWDDATRWRASDGGSYEATAPFVGIHGFRINALAVIGRRLQPIVEQWLEAQGKPELLKVFVTTVLAEWWEEKGATADDVSLFARREVYPTVEDGSEVAVPRGGVLLTAFADVQADRVEAGVEAWGRGEENWKVAYRAIEGDPTALPVWEELWEWVTRPWPMERGGFEFVRSFGVDSGYAAQSVYAFVTPHRIYATPDGRRSFTWATKGVTGSGHVWPLRPTLSKLGGTNPVKVYPVKVDTAKTVVFRRFDIEEPGPGFQHYPMSLDANYFRQLTAEQVVVKTNARGFPSQVWELRKGQRRNEAFDVAVGNYAALCALYSMGVDLDLEIEKAEQRGPWSPPDGDDTAAATAESQPQRTQRRRRQSRSSYVTG